MTPSKHPFKPPTQPPTTFIPRETKKAVDNKDQVDFGPYVKKLQKTIRRNWQPHHQAGLKAARVVALFHLNCNGEILDLVLTEASADQQFNQTALAAIQKSAPFEKLPAAFNGNSLPVQFIFDIHANPPRPSCNIQPTKTRRFFCKLFEV